MAPITMSKVFTLRTCCLITGASKGLGQCLAVRLAQRFPKGSLLILLARNVDGLRKTKELIEKATSSVTVQIKAVDLGKAGVNSEEPVDLSKLLADFVGTPDHFDQSMIIHNAGSMGDVTSCLSQQMDSKHLKEYWDLNLTSVILLNSVFLNYFRGTILQREIVVNISSICSLQPFKSWALYCAGKAARDMLFRTMALEEPSVRVLNYAPGPLNTDMQLMARTMTADKDLRNMFIDLHEKGTLIQCDQTVDKLFKLLEENTFDSGAHIDYYDVV